LLHGCSIDYSGSQFAHSAKNLASASQKSDEIDATLLPSIESVKLVEIPLPNFCNSGLGFVPKQDGEWRIIYHLSAPAQHSVND